MNLLRCGRLLTIAGMVCMTLVVLCLLAATVSADDTVLVFTYFTGNGEDGLHIAWSNDGLIWEKAAGGASFLAPEVGNQRLMRDPSVARGPNGVFHMVWTVSWNDRVIGYASSPDLVHWTEQRTIPVMLHESEARNCWAPDLFYNKSTNRFVIVWSTTIPGRFPETEASSETSYNHRMYYTTTADFQTFTPTMLLFDPGFNCIDGTIASDGDRYVLFFKDETLDPPAKNIRIAFSDAAIGPYVPTPGPITGDFWAEGPTAIQIDGRWLIYFDMYRKNRYGVIVSDDLRSWRDISDSISFPDGARHGTVLQVERSILSGVMHR